MKRKFDLSRENVFVISDPHFFHENIIKFCGRPFSDKLAMNQKIIEDWNSVVAEKDIVICLGDFSLHVPDKWIISVLNKLNGRIIFLKGNHDSQKVWNKIAKLMPGKIELICDYLEGYFENISEKFKVLDVVFCHYPFVTWRGKERGSFHFFGHVHGNYIGKGRSIEVSLDNRKLFGDFWGPLDIRKVIDYILEEEALKTTEVQS
jgi:calcineurin-like phosphoesterase family protein